MNAKLEILELLEGIRPDGRCDDCLSSELNIKPRQSVNLACRPLAAEGRITRIKAECSLCDKVKLTNTMVSAIDFRRVEPRTSSLKAPASTAKVIDIERARTEIVRVCRALWQETQTAEAPRSISAVIGQLRNAGCIPYLQASLMFTLCALRNVSVYEGTELSADEQAVAQHAAAAIGSWWQTRPKVGHS